MVSRIAFRRLLAGIVLGAVTSWILLNGGFFVLRNIWDAYAAAEPERAYSLAMLFVRLGIFSTMIAGTSIVATLVSRDLRMRWVAGIIILAVSIPDHLYPGLVWDKYPPWYHIAYLVSIVPIAVIAGRAAQSRVAGNAAARDPRADPANFAGDG